MFVGSKPKASSGVRSLWWQCILGTASHFWAEIWRWLETHDKSRILWTPWWNFACATLDCNTRLYHYPIWIFFVRGRSKCGMKLTCHLNLSKAGRTLKAVRLFSWYIRMVSTAANRTISQLPKSCNRLVIIRAFQNKGFLSRLVSVKNVLKLKQSNTLIELSTPWRSRRDVLSRCCVDFGQ